MAAGDGRSARPLAAALAMLLLVWLLGPARAVASPPQRGEPDELERARERLQTVWQPASVVWPLAPLGLDDPHPTWAVPLAMRVAALDGRQPTASVRGPVALDRDRAAGVWLPALATVRVRRVSGATALQFVRSVDANLAVIEPGRAVPCPGASPSATGDAPSCWELQQPPGHGALWSIESAGPARVVIERPVPRSPRYVAVEVEADLLAWIAAGEDGLRGEQPAVLEPSDDLADRLRLDLWIARELIRLGGDGRPLARAVVAWRMLAAMHALDRARAPVRPYFAPVRPGPLALAGTAPVELQVSDSRRYRGAARPSQWGVVGDGPGLIHVAARSWAPRERGSPLQPAELRVWAEGRLVARLPLSAHPAQRAADPDTALPRLEPIVTEVGDPVGELAELSLVLPPGQREYSVELVGGPALISMTRALRLEASGAALRGWTPRRRARAATRAAERSPAAVRPWLHLLLAELDHTAIGPDPELDRELVALGSRSPLLAATLAGRLLAASSEVSHPRLSAAVDELGPWLVALDRDPELPAAVRGQVRGQWLALLAQVDRPDLVAGVLVGDRAAVPDPIAELPAAGVRALAELLGPSLAVERSPALGLLRLALDRAPADTQLRDAMQRAWVDRSRWSQRRPVPRAKDGRAGTVADLDASFRPRGTWLVAREQPPSDARERAGAWWRVGPGEPADLLAEVGPGPIRAPAGTNQGPGGARLALVDVHVAVPPGTRAATGLRVDGRLWWTPPLATVQRHRLALAPGRHRIELLGPADAIAWTDARPADPSRWRDPGTLGHAQPLWPADGVIWRLPGPPLPGFVRVELRWTAAALPQPVRLRVLADGRDTGQVLVLDPRALGPDGELDSAAPIDTGALPLSGSPAAGPRHTVVLPIAATTTTLHLVAEGPGADAAAVALAVGISLRRGPRHGDGRPSETSDADLLPNPLARASASEAGLLPPAREDPVDLDPALERLARLSARLRTDPDDPDARASRAALLLELGETGHARADLVMLAALVDRADPVVGPRAAGLLDALEQQFQALTDPREIVVAQVPTQPALIEPPLAAAIGDQELALAVGLPLWSSLREDQLGRAQALARIDAWEAAATATPDPPGDLALLAELTRAAVLERAPLDATAAATAYLRALTLLGGPPNELPEPLAVAVAAVAPLLEHLEDPRSDARLAGLAHGLARALNPRFGHSSVRRLEHVAALRSQWRRLHHNEANAGFERLALARDARPRSTAEVVRDALLVAPWPTREAEQLAPGRRGVLEWNADPGEVTAQLWCRALRPDLLRGDARPERPEQPERIATARLRVRLHDARGRVEHDRVLELGDGQAGAVTLPVAEPGWRRLEVTLADDPQWLCSWRSSTRGRDPSAPAAPLATQQAARWWNAEPRRPVELVVLGPASLELELRATDSGGRVPPAAQPTRARHVLVELAPVTAEGPRLATLALAPDDEPAIQTERARRFAVGAATRHTLLLTEPGPHRLRLTSDRGRVLVRARLREDRGDLPPPDRVSIHEWIDPRDPGPIAIAGLGVVAGSTPIDAAPSVAPIPDRVGTFTLHLRAGLDEIGEVDDLRPRPGLDAQVGWRRALVEDRLWLAVSGESAVRERSPPVGGGAIELAANLPLGVRAGASVRALVERFATATRSLAASARAYAFVDRPIWLGPYLQLRPGVTFGWRWQSLDPAAVATAGATTGATGLEPHPDIYTRYLDEHPLVLRPELELRAFVLQDVALWGETRLASNADLRSLDHLDVEIGMAGIARRPRIWVPTWGLSYQASPRFADQHRPRTFVRHRLSTELGLGIWAQDAARVTLGVSNQLFVSKAAPVRGVVELWLRIDASLGRRLRDYGPRELWFTEPWAPRAWGDDERQATSTIRPR